MTRTRQITIGFALGRVAFGAGLLGPPRALATGSALPPRARSGTVALAGLSAITAAALALTEDR